MRIERTSLHGLGFAVVLDRQPTKDVIRVQALGLDVLVCETTEPNETARRWANTVKDLDELQRIGEATIKRGTPAALVQSAFIRLHERRGIPNLNYIG